MPELPFTAQEFFDVFGRYNRAVWPAQYLLVGVATLIVVSVLRRERPRLVLGLLAALWLWTGVVYHLTFFAEINPAAAAFGILFVAQAALLLWSARAPAACVRSPGGTFGAAAGKALIAYALLGYPLIAYFAGHHYPETPTFGAPCPTTIFTLGVVLCSPWRLRWWVTVIPLIWTVIGTSAATQLAVPQDYGLTVAGIITLGLLVRGQFVTRAPSPQPGL